MPAAKRLIVNADDFGQSTGINEGIIEAFENGIVTSSSLMVRWPGAAKAAEYALKNPDLSLGLHLDLGEWMYRDEQWVSLYEVVRTSDHVAVEAEISRQLAAFEEMTGRRPTHIDSHQHVHRVDPVRSILKEKADAIGVPLRLYSPVQYCGAFYGQTASGTPLWDNISFQALIGLLENLNPGVTELGCHPAKHVDFETMYRAERVQELEILCDRRVPAFIDEQDIGLCSFKTFSAH